jgi:hypothetical protein
MRIKTARRITKFDKINILWSAKAREAPTSGHAVTFLNLRS